MAANGAKRQRVGALEALDEPFNLAALQPETLQLVFMRLPSSSKAALNATCRQFSAVMRELVLSVEMPLAQLAAGKHAAGRHDALSSAGASNGRLAGESSAGGGRACNAAAAEAASKAGAITRTAGADEQMPQLLTMSSPTQASGATAAKAPTLAATAPTSSSPRPSSSSPKPSAAAAAATAVTEGDMERELLCRLGLRHTNLRALTLHNNAATPPKEVAHQFGLLAAGALPGLTSLELRDAQFWKLPWPFGASLRQLSTLSVLRQLKVLVQVPGVQYGLPGGSADPAWQARFGRELLQLSALTSLDTLQMRCIAGERGFFTSPAYLEAVSGLTNLRSLDCGYVTVTGGSLTNLCALTRLTTLVLYGDFSAMKLQELTALAPLQRLNRLELFHDGVMPPLTDPGNLAGDQPSPVVLDQVQEALLGLSNLEWLNLPVCPATWSILPMIKNMASLRELYVQNIDMDHLDFDDLATFVNAETLRVLQLDNVLLSPVVLSALTPMTLLTQLVLFNMNPQPNGTADQLSALSTLSNLRQFCMDALFTEEGQAVLSNDCLAALARCWTALESLHFTYVMPPDAEPLLITAMHHFTRLQDLSLSGDHSIGTVRLDCSCLPAQLHSLCLSHVGLQQVQSIPMSVQHLWLAHCMLVIGSLVHITEALVNLRTLIVKAHPPSQAYVFPLPVQQAIGRLQHLESLGLSSTYEELQLRSFSSLTNLQKLVLDYSLDPGLVDAGGVLEQLQGLTTLRRLKSLWLSDNVLGGGGDILLWQHMLQQGAMPLLCIRPCASDWWFKTSFPVGSCLDVDNPISSWHMWNAWNIL